jgi:hypothetical protein
MLKQELYSLRESNTGEKIVADIVEVQSAYPGNNADKLPDLSIIWADLPPARAVESATLGSFSGRIGTGRGGNHRPNAFLLLSRVAARRATPLTKPTHIAELGTFICALATE